MQISVPNLRPIPLLLQNILNRKMGKIQQKRKFLEAEARLGESIACLARTIWKVLARIPLVKSGVLVLQVCGRLQIREKSAHSHTAGLRRNSAKGLKEVAPKVQCSDERDKEFGLCISRRGAAKIVIDFTEELNHDETKSDVSDFLQQYCAMPNFEAKTRRSIKFVMEILISVAPTLQNLRIGVGGDRVARALGSRSSVEAGKEKPEAQGET